MKKLINYCYHWCRKEFYTTFDNPYMLLLHGNFECGDRVIGFGGGRIEILWVISRGKDFNKYLVRNV